MMRAIRIFLVWGGRLVAVVAAYDVCVSQFVPAQVREKYLLGSLGWSWQIWLIIVLLFMLVNLGFGKSAYSAEDTNANAPHYENSPRVGRDHYGDIIYKIKPGTKKDAHKVAANLKLEPGRVDIDVIGVTIFNSEDKDFTDKSAELLSFGRALPDGTFSNSINILGYERRGLTWFEKEKDITPGGHSFIEIASVDEHGVHLGSLITQHNSDEATWKVGVLVSGKLDGNPIFPKSFSLTFIVRKNILKNDREVWVIGWPRLEMGEDNW